MSDELAVLRRLYRRTMTAISRGRVKIVDDTGSIQRMQVDLGPKGKDGSSLQLRDQTPVAQLFGFSGNPPIGADVITVSFGGDHNKSVVIGVNHQPSRLKNLQSGDSAQYDVRGAYMRFQASGIVIDAAGGNVTVQNAKEVTVSASDVVTVNGTNGIALNGNTTVTGTLHVTQAVTGDKGATFANDVVANGISLDSHVHGGVTAGGANTAGPH